MTKVFHRKFGGANEITQEMEMQAVQIPRELSGDVFNVRKEESMTAIECGVEYQGEHCVRDKGHPDRHQSFRGTQWSSFWNLFVNVDSHNVAKATLVEDGKIDYSVEIHKEQLPWFNALREALRHEGHLLYRPEKEPE